MGRRAEGAFDEMYDGLQALGDVLIGTLGSEVTYEMGYLEGWSDAMHHFDWAYHGKPVKAKKAFPMFRASGARSLARKAFKKRRGEKL